MKTYTTVVLHPVSLKWITAYVGSKAGAERVAEKVCARAFFGSLRALAVRVEAA